METGKIKQNISIMTSPWVIFAWPWWHWCSTWRLFLPKSSLGSQDLHKMKTSSENSLSKGNVWVISCSQVHLWSQYSPGQRWTASSSWWCGSPGSLPPPGSGSPWAWSEPGAALSSAGWRGLGTSYPRYDPAQCWPACPLGGLAGRWQTASGSQGSWTVLSRIQIFEYLEPKSGIWYLFTH